MTSGGFTMKKVIRNLLAVTLAACVVMPLTSCKKDTKKTGKNTNTEESDPSDDREDLDTDNISTGSDEDKNTPKTLKMNTTRTVSADETFYNSDIAELKLTPIEGVDFATKEFTTASIVGDRVLANVKVTLKNPAMADKLLENGYVQLDEDIYYSLQLFDLSGQNLATIPLEDQCDFLRAFPMNNGEILVTTAKFNPGDCKSTPAFFVISASGEKLRDLEFDTQGSLYSLQAYPMNNGNFFIAAEGKLFLFDSEGKLIKKNADQSLGCYMNYSDGKWYVARTMPPTNDIGAYQEVDINTGELKKVYKVDEETAIELSKNTDCLLFTESGVKQFNIEQGKSTQILSFTSSNVNCAHLTNGQILSDGSMLFLNVDPDVDNGKNNTECVCHYANTMSVAKLTRADKNPNAGKEILSVGLFTNTDPFFVDKVLEYNSDSSNHAYIELRTISDLNLIGEADDILIRYLGYSAQEVTKEMYQGTAPDLLVGFSDLAEFNTSEYLLDLKTYLESDSSIKKDDYFYNIFDAFETDGKLFNLPLTYTLNGMALNGAELDTKGKWTFADLDKLKSSLMPEMTLLPNYTGEEMLLPMLSAVTTDFINYEKGEADFNNDDFKALLDALKNNTIPESKYGSGIILRDGHVMTPEMQYSNSMTASFQAHLAALDEYCIIEDGNASQETIFTGYPSSQGMGMTARAGLSMAISKCASNPDLAWEIIRYFLSTENQQYVSNGMNTIPVSRTAYDANCQTQIDLSTALYKEYSKDPENFGSEPVRITDERKAEFAEVISSVDNSYRLDSEIFKIVLGEADRYFRDFQELDSTCQSIQQKAAGVMKTR